MVVLDNYPGIISSKQISLILEQLNKCICKVYSSDGSFATGFFCFISYNNKRLPVLIVNNHLLNEEKIKKIENISFELNSEKKIINIKDNRMIYTNKEYDITIIEINPDKDFIYNFLELDENIFKQEQIFLRKSIYTVQCDKRVSFGVLKNIDNYRIIHFCSTERGSTGSPIINLSNGKIIGIHCSSSSKFNYNLGTFLKYPVINFIDKFKGYIISKEKIISKTYSITAKSDNEAQILDFENKNNAIENELKEKNKILEEKIIHLQKLLNNNNQKNYINLDKGNPNEYLDAILKKDKEIEELKLKLSRFPFELGPGEKLMSIIIYSIDQKVHYPIICKKTDKFCNIEIQLYDAYPEYSESINFFTVNGIKINRNKNLDDNKIKNHDIIVLNKMGYYG